MLSDMHGNPAALAASEASLTRPWPKLNSPVNVDSASETRPESPVNIDSASEIGPESVVNAPRGDANDKVDDPVSACRRSPNCADSPEVNDVDAAGEASDSRAWGIAEVTCVLAAWATAAAWPANPARLVVCGAAVNGVTRVAVAELAA
jgi:hypothetical protein